MALTQSKLNQIPQRNKDLTFGYIKECEQNQNSSIPSMIKYLCLIYLNLNKDEFDTTYTHSDIEINNDSIKAKPYIDRAAVNSFLTNVVNSGVNIWRFQSNGCRHELIGIRKSASGLTPSDLDGWFDEGEDNESIGYGYFPHKPALTNPDNCNQCGKRWGKEDYHAGDIIQMKLDCIEWTLSYKINNVDYGKAFDIESNTYRAAITLFPNSDEAPSYTLISYQHIY